MRKSANIHFNRNGKQFHIELRKRVDKYFHDNNIPKTGNSNMFVKTTILFSAYLIPYFILVFQVFDQKIIWLFIAAIMGIAMAGIGMSVMHDANHGSYSKNNTFNRLLGYFSIGMLAGSSINWRIQHNLIHHTYTNIHDHDEDIAPPGFLRFDPHAKRRSVHQFQFLYAWFFYSLMTVLWSTIKDFVQLNQYHKDGLLKGRKLWLIKGVNTSLTIELSIIIVSKILYFSYMLLPYFLIKEMSFSDWVIGYLFLHAVAGLIMAMVFQLAHVANENEFPLPAENGTLENHWAVHQLKTTMNFAPDNKFLTWYVGGLNHQVEHHLFPNICHVHYPRIAHIVAQTAKEFELPYKTKPSFLSALCAHEIMLWKLGKEFEPIS